VGTPWLCPCVGGALHSIRAMIEHNRQRLFLI
jgi:hypothetical protein